jgi:hypothetical protein
MEYNFLPNWYKLKSRKKNKFIINVFIIVLFLVNIFLLYNMCSINNNILIIKNSYNVINYKPHKNIIESNQSLTLNNFMNFLKFKDIDNIYSITVRDNTISASFKINNMDDYESETKDIEDDEDYRIINLMAPENTTKNFQIFQIDIEVIK